MGRRGKSGLLYDQVLSIDEWLSKVEPVTPDQVRAAARPTLLGYRATRMTPGVTHSRRRSSMHI